MNSQAQLHIAFAAFTPAYYRWEVQRMIPVIYPDDETQHMEPDVGQVDDELLPEDAVIGDPVWAVYGRRADGIADHISDFDELEAALNLVRALGCSSMNVPPGPTSECHGRPVLFSNDDCTDWRTDDWAHNAHQLAVNAGRHFGEVINTQAEVWDAVLESTVHRRSAYKAQHLLEEIVSLMIRAI